VSIKLLFCSVQTPLLFCSNASEDVVIQLLISKCLPILLYGLDVCCLREDEVNSLDFVNDRFSMKLFRTNKMNTIKHCQTYFNLNIPSELLVKRYDNFFVEIVCN